MLLLLWNIISVIDCTSSPVSLAESEILVSSHNDLIERLSCIIPQFGRPLQLHQDTVSIYVGLNQIMNVDESSGLWTVKLDLKYEYKSEDAKWDPNEYANTSALMVSTKKFWVPNIVLNEAVEMKTSSSINSCSSQAVHSSGTVTPLICSVIAVLSCTLDVTYFPFDKQTCQVTFASDIESDYILELKATDSLKSFILNSEWHMVGKPTISFPDNEIKTEVVCSIQLKRRYQFYMFVLVFPNMTLYILAGLTFKIPIESGDKISFAITTLLAQIVVFGTLISIFPSSSVGFPVLTYYICVLTVHLSLLCVLASFVMSIWFTPRDTLMPQWKQALISSKLVKFIGLKQFKPRYIYYVTEAAAQPSKDKNDDPFFKYPEISEESLAESWNYYARFADRLIFICHYIVVSIVTVTYMLQLRKSL
ncbi:neuronal acetylcholine receptor subunit beta-3-like [Symsagittifera roscoffensis]|uniref:neuronal acetylcholine receptor subunit beta-3-like n=1 Tax=Symsagittifera roscoffensis TaxID=84072 RepID=UPI00307B8008